MSREYWAKIATHVGYALEACAVFGTDAVPLLRRTKVHVVDTEQLQILRVPSEQGLQYTLEGGKKKNLKREGQRQPTRTHLPHPKVEVRLIDSREVAIEI